MWAAIAEFWWIGPTMIGAGTLGWIGLRGQRSAKARRLAYDASRDALRTARQDAAASRIAVRVARAELAQAIAEVHALDHDAMVEPFLDGSDVEVPVITCRGAPALLPMKTSPSTSA